MTAVAAKLNFMIDHLSEQKQEALLTIVQSMVDPDDYLTVDDLNVIQQSREELSKGEYYTLNDIDWK